MRLYLDTSVIGATQDPGPRDRVEATHRLMEAIRRGSHTGVISDLVLFEIRQAGGGLKARLLETIRQLPVENVAEDDRSAALVRAYEEAKMVRPTAGLDLRHIAVATVYGADALVSWNFHDIVNIRTRRGIHAVNLRLGYALMEIASPLEVVGDA